MLGWSGHDPLYVLEPPITTIEALYSVVPLICSPRRVSNTGQNFEILTPYTYTYIHTHTCTYIYEHVYLYEYICANIWIYVGI